MGLLDDAKRAWQETSPGPPKPVEGTAQPTLEQRYEYDVLEMREKLLSGRGSAPSEKLRDMLNDRAREGWQFKAMVAAEVAGVIGKRDGWMAILEREVRR